MPITQMRDEGATMKLFLATVAGIVGTVLLLAIL